MIKEIAKTLNGKYEDNEAKLNALSKDFGLIYSSLPKGCLTPGSTDDVSKIVSYCNENKIPVITRGMSHSASGQCLVNDGIVINIKSLNTIHEVVFNGSKGHVIVDAGATWEKLVKETLKFGATPPTLTDWQKLTVGGTISTSGVGFMSHCNGIQADNVMELEVVIGNGQVLNCSSTINPDLFNLVRAGLGQFGVITKVKIPLVKAPKKMHTFKMLISDTQEFYNLIESIKEEKFYECIHSFLIPNNRDEFEKKLGKQVVTENLEKFKAQISNSSGFSYFLEIVQYEYEGIPFTLKKPEVENYYEVEGYFSYITKEPPLIETQKKKGKTAHPELALFIPNDSLVEFMEHFLKDHRSEDMSEGPVLLIPLNNALINAPLSIRPQSDFYFIGILRNAYPNTPKRVDYLSDLNRRLYKVALEYNGKRYPVDSMDTPRNKKEWKEHFGSVWNQMEEGKQKFDPNNTFKSLLNIFEVLEPIT